MPIFRIKSAAIPTAIMLVLPYQSLLVSRDVGQWVSRFKLSAETF